MHNLGRELGESLRLGDVIVLQGPLGAGKTALVKGIGAYFGITSISSPTFVISRVHHGSVRFNHVDAYRLLGEEKSNLHFDDLDIETSDAITVIEWGNEVVARLTDDYLLMEIEFGKDLDSRVIKWSGYGQRWQGFQL